MMGRIHPDVVNAERYGIKPDAYHGAWGKILKHTTSHGREIYDARNRYKNKKFIVLPTIPHGADINHLLDPTTQDVDYELARTLRNKVLDTLEHAYGKPKIDIQDKISGKPPGLVSYLFSHINDRVPVGRYVSFKVGTEGRHAVAEIPRGDDTTEFFNSGYIPSDYESKLYNLPKKTYDLQEVGVCASHAGLRLTQSELHNQEYIDKLNRTKFRKNIRNTDVIPVYIWQTLNLKGIEKTDEEQPDTFKKGGIIKKPTKKVNATPNN